MLRPSPTGTTISIEQEELRGIARTVAEIHWLLLILVLLYLIFGGAREDAEANAAIWMGLFFYAALVMSFRYANFYRRETRWKIAIETAGMLLFTTWVLWYTDGLASPLLNAYLLPVITSALTLGKVFTLITVVLIAVCYVVLGGGIEPAELLSLPFIGAFFAQLAPVVLVAESHDADAVLRIDAEHRLPVEGTSVRAGIAGPIGQTELLCSQTGWAPSGV